MKASRIQADMKVFGSCGYRLGTVDRVEGNSIKLTRFDPRTGAEDHYIPLGLVESIDEAVYLSKTCAEVMEEWHIARL